LSDVGDDGFEMMLLTLHKYIIIHHS